MFKFNDSIYFPLYDTSSIHHGPRSSDVFILYSDSFLVLRAETCIFCQDREKYHCYLRVTPDVVKTVDMSLLCREVLWQAEIQSISLENLIQSQLEVPSRAQLLSAWLWPRNTPFFWTGNQVLETDLKGWQMTLDSANLFFTQVLWKSLELLLISVAKLQISHGSPKVICV